MYRDYAPKGVRFYYIYKALAHPELDGYITPFTLEERLMHVAEAQRELGSEVTWLCDTMANEAKHALGDAPNSEFIFDPEGRLVVRRRWSDPAALRQDLARLVGPAESRTQVSDLNLPSPPPPERAPTGVVPRLEVPWGMIPLKAEPIPDEKETPFYAKLRVEAERSLLQEGKGKLYLGFFLDPLYKVHWNNEVAPVRFHLDVPDTVTAKPSNGEGPKVDAKSDADPREFLVDVSAEDSDQPLTASVYYFACNDAETFCVPVTQRYRFRLARDPDGGRRISGAGMTGIVRRLLENDADGDGRLVREELPEQMQGRFDRLDANQDGVIDDDELKQLSQRGRGGMMSRLFAADADGDGRISREEAPERMERSFDRMDSNGDGFIDEEEIERMRKRFQNRQPQ